MALHDEPSMRPEAPICGCANHYRKSNFSKFFTLLAVCHNNIVIRR